MRMVGYCRVSTDQQVNEGLSLTVQEEKISGYAKLYDIELVEIVRDEGLSAGTLKRPGLQRVLGMLSEDKVDGVIITNLDRLTRSVKDLGYLLEEYFSNGWILASVAEKIDTSTAAGRMTLNVLTSVAQWERERTGERTKDILASKKAKGECIGNIPYGKKLSDDGIHVEDNLNEQDIIYFVKTHRMHGKTFNEIKMDLFMQKLYTRNNKPFTISAIHRIANL